MARIADSFRVRSWPSPPPEATGFLTPIRNTLVELDGLGRGPRAIGSPLVGHRPLVVFTTGGRCPPLGLSCPLCWPGANDEGLARCLFDIVRGRTGGRAHTIDTREDIFTKLDFFTKTMILCYLAKMSSCSNMVLIGIMCSVPLYKESYDARCPYSTYLTYLGFRWVYGR